MAACLDGVPPNVHERKQLDPPISECRHMQGKLANMYTRFNACRACMYAVATACHRGCASRKDAVGAILYAGEKATWMAGDSILCLDGNDYINAYATGHLWCGAKLYETGAGTSEIRRMLFAGELFAETP